VDETVASVVRLASRSSKREETLVGIADALASRTGERSVQRADLGDALASAAARSELDLEEDDVAVLLSALDPSGSGTVSIHELRDLVERCIARPMAQHRSVATSGASASELATLSVSGVMPGRGGGAASDRPLRRAEASPAPHPSVAARLTQRLGLKLGLGGLGADRGQPARWQGGGGGAREQGGTAGVALSRDEHTDGGAVGGAEQDSGSDAELRILRVGTEGTQGTQTTQGAHGSAVTDIAAVEWSGRWPGRGGASDWLGREEDTPFEAEGSTPHDVARAEAAAQRTASPSASPMVRDIPLPKFVGDPMDAHGALRQLQQQRIRELLQHVASLIDVQSQLEQSPPAVLQAMPELKFDRVCAQPATALCGRPNPLTVCRYRGAVGVPCPHL
jgi:hypothetical protein